MLTGFDRDRIFYPTLLTVIATYYILFAVMGNILAGGFLALLLMRCSGFALTA